MDARTVLPDSEMALLSACLNHGPSSYFVASEHVTLEDLSLPSLKAIFRAIGRVAEKGARPDAHTVWAELGEDERCVEQAGGRAYLLDIVGAPALLGNVELYATQVHSESVKRRVRELLEGTLNDMDVGSFALPQLQEALFRLEDLPRETVSLTDVMMQVQDEADNPQLAGLPFPWYEIQSLTLCGMQPGMLVILAAETSVGKTAAALEITDHLIKRDHAVLYLSMEMAPLELGRRMAQRRGYNLADHFAGKGHENIGAVKSAWDSYNRGRQSQISRVERVEQIPALIRRYKPDLVVVDHMGLLEAEGRNPYERVSNVSRSLKLLAERYEIPLMALSRLSRRPDQRGKVPGIDRLRDSGRIEEDASIVLMVHRERDEAQVFGAKGCFVVAKNRGGRQGRVEFEFDADRQRFAVVGRKWDS